MKKYLIFLSVTLAAAHICTASETAMLKLFDRAYNLTPEKNLLLSPYGIEQCFGMAACGAGKFSGKEFKDILGIDPASPKKPLSKSRYGVPAEVNSFNAVLVNRQYTLQPDFIRMCRNTYNSKIYKIDFSRPEKCAELLNQLIKRESRNLFDKIFTPDDLQQDDAAVLMNVLYFKAGWKTCFQEKETAAELFYPYGQAPYEVDMMHAWRSHISFFEEDGIQAVTLNFADYNYRMLFIMTENKNLPLSKVTGFLAQKGIRYIEENSFYNNQVKLYLPKLKLESNTDLVTLCKAMGMKTVFDPISGDMDKMIVEKPLYIAKARQLVKLNLDEKGTEVSAVTYAIPKAASAFHQEIKERTFRADHPFAAVLYHRQTKDILMFSAIVEP